MVKAVFRGKFMVINAVLEKNKSLKSIISTSTLKTRKRRANKSQCKQKNNNNKDQISEILNRKK